MNEALFIVWKNYQRRVEVLAPHLRCKALFLPHIFRKKEFRVIDYLFKLLVSFYTSFQQKPRFIVAQSPPLYSAISALLLKIPYVIDAHNPVFQDVGGRIDWRNLPLSNFLIKNACAVVVHNHSILKVAKQAYPDMTFFNIPDPIEAIGSSEKERLKNQILVICSFDADEPVDILLDSIAKLPDYTFVITADPIKLSQNLQVKLQTLSNVKLTGFLPIQEYHDFLCGSMATLVLTNQDLIQPSGACEALSSNTPLIVSNTPLIKELFGEWAILVENTVPSIVTAIQNLQLKSLDLSSYRNAWNKTVRQEIERLLSFIPYKAT